MTKGSRQLLRVAACACVFHFAQSMTLMSTADDEMEALVRAKATHWFQLAESALQEVDYRNELSCSADDVAHVNAVIHIKLGRWHPLCGVMARPHGSNNSAIAGRASELAKILDKVVPMLPKGINVKLPFSLHDGVQNVHEGNMKVPVFGHTYHPIFSSIAIPFAMGNRQAPDGAPTAHRNTPVVGWNTFAKKWFTCNSSLPRIQRAVFRGEATHRSMKYGTCTNACSWRDNGRLLVHNLGQERPNLFDASVSNVDSFNISELTAPKKSEPLPMTSQLCDYKAILAIGNNLDWADRLRQSFYGNAVVVLPKGAPHEFFNTFMEPYKAYWPVESDLSNLASEVDHVLALKNATQQLEAQKKFAGTFLTEHFMLLYNRIMIEEYDRRANPWRPKFPRMPAASATTLAQEARQALGVDGCVGGKPQVCPQGQGPA